MQIELGEFRVSDGPLTGRPAALVADMTEIMRGTNLYGGLQADYGAIWSNEEFADRPDRAVMFHPYMDGDTRPRLLERLKGRPVIDVCSGTGTRPFFTTVIRSGISSYLGIDHNVEHVVASRPEQVPGIGRVTRLGDILPITGGFLEGDVLKHLSSVEIEGGTNVIINGIDDFIITDRRMDFKAYWAEVAAHIDRLVPLGGHVIGYTAAGGLLPMVADRPSMQAEIFSFCGPARPDDDSGFYDIVKVA